MFAWRQLYRRGLLNPKGAQDEAPLLPVTIETPTIAPSQTHRGGREVRRESARQSIEIELANGHRIVVHAGVDAQLLRRVIAVLVRT